ncbi:hypothetical protein [Rhodospirillum rubrum]|uniref:YMGG-like Gly-zipper domain-containing protein n=1 Tax=Rhodospirillum rubrum (strain ATCC 11170 / ATH 1.1.1 / DSM 467 / LMG 4362 / NCIMB 8255 / S1) TaxID=269796 RepID=Q2RU92_RHORT|nr:hypothetical protein [Rhodospirillum rubrum]ABC22303.1 conserved hypothetical protein [Rhodospirillum rubrum ATCC 11170]AEO48022.1 hypothetical protein F11_07760 [Rhodospirillum rubrum F11]MBK5953871.1 hypothetical protein [Rhodospirillum rubrum]QXG81945.1 hypothetical protein KUL73_07785 [Rhodospirillum rubrum]HAQ00951.1 hypothetical protein [Rhodospirillum rubrum]
MKRAFIALSLVVSAVSLSACGESTGDRALSGGAIGAGAGAGAGLLFGAPATGAAVGGAVGAGTGALTDSKQIDLGKPVWR